MARDAKDAGQPAQAGALLVGAQNLLFARFTILLPLHVLAQAALAGVTFEPLLAVPGLAMLANSLASTMVTVHDPQFDSRPPLEPLPNF